MTDDRYSEERFWAAIDAARRADARPTRLVSALTVELARWPIPAILWFRETIEAKCDVMLRWNLWGAADLIFDGFCTEDCFVDFRQWIVAQGRAVFDDVIRDPDSLARHPLIVSMSQLPRPRGDDQMPQIPDLVFSSHDAFDIVRQKLRPDLRATINWPDRFDRPLRDRPNGLAPHDHRRADRVQSQYPQLLSLFGQA